MTADMFSHSRFGLLSLLSSFLGIQLKPIPSHVFSLAHALTNVLKEQLLKQGRRPYVIPVGGSNSLGTCGKAAYGMMKDMTENPKKWEGRKVLFIHTGGLLGLFDKVDQMGPLVGNWQRMDVSESIPRKVGIGKMF
ncbi:hypothetical protein V6N12_019143 [Hibiscus sabdariffa]|uniref:Uncharacterized protein n=1 Tax=Hibiscus sabdariffa TaxID=183260 RepID=A0ABR2BA50_9ROSI